MINKYIKLVESIEKEITFLDEMDDYKRYIKGLEINNIIVTKLKHREKLLNEIEKLKNPVVAPTPQPVVASIPVQPPVIVQPEVIKPVEKQEPEFDMELDNDSAELNDGLPKLDGFDELD